MNSAVELPVFLFEMGVMSAFYLASAFFFGAGRPLSKQSDVPMARNIENTVAWLQIYTAIDYILWTIYSFYRLSHPVVDAWHDSLVFFDLTTYPIALLLGGTLLTKQKPRWWHVPCIILPMAVCAILRALCGWTILLSIALVYTFLIIAVFFVYYFLRYRHYANRLRMEYADTEGREINWFLQLEIPLLIPFISYGAFTSLSSEMLAVAYLIELACMLLIYNRLLHLRIGKYAIAEDLQEDLPEEEPDREAGSEEELAVFSEIALRLAELEKQSFFLDNDITLQSLARQVGTNRTYLSRYFNHRLNTTFYAYINGLRLERARTLLESGNYDKPALVWEDCGFGNETSFRKLFKTTYGCTPIQYAAQSEKPQDA